MIANALEVANRREKEGKRAKIISSVLILGSFFSVPITYFACWVSNCGTPLTIFAVLGVSVMLLAIGIAYGNKQNVYAKSHNNYIYYKKNIIVPLLQDLFDDNVVVVQTMESDGEFDSKGSDVLKHIDFFSVGNALTIRSEISTFYKTSPVTIWEIDNSRKSVDHDGGYSYQSIAQGFLVAIKTPLFTHEQAQALAYSSGVQNFKYKNGVLYIFLKETSLSPGRNSLIPFIFGRSEEETEREILKNPQKIKNILDLILKSGKRDRF